MVSKSGNQKGGGYGSRQHVQTPVRTGTGSRGTNPGGVGQLGQKQGTHTTNRTESSYRGEPLHIGGTLNTGVKFGNEVALNSKSAPGQGRTIHSCGSQGVHGSTNPGNPRPNTYREALEQE
jgi:hypothetical protein